MSKAAPNNEPWILRGDVNFTAYGGCLIRKHWNATDREEYPTLANVYDVFYLIPTEETGNGYNQAIMYCIDYDDVTTDDIKDILEARGYEDQITPKKTKADYEAELSVETILSEIVTALGGGRWDNYSTYTTDYPTLRSGLSSDEDWEEIPEYITDNDLYDWMVALGMKEYLGGLEKTEG